MNKPTLPTFLGPAFLADVQPAAFMQENDPQRNTLFEPGLLPMFRMIVLVQLILGVVGLILIPFIPTERPSLPLLWDQVVEVGVVALMLLYLYSSVLQTKLHTFYLPIAIGLYSLGGLIYNFWFRFYILRNPQMFADGQAPRPEEIGWLLFVMLLIPLVVTAWQYTMKQVFLYVFIIALIDSTFFLIFSQSTGLWSIQALLFILFGRTLAFLAIGYIVTRMIGAQREQRMQLADANLKLTQYATTLEQLTISRERNRMARELHDTLAHSLSAVSVQLEAVDSTLDHAPETARHLLNKALLQTRSGLTETRRAMQSLRASPLEDMGLVLSLRSLAESTSRRHGIPIDLKLPESDPALSPVLEQSIYRIAQEALTNISKHARAQRGWLSLAVQEQVELTIRDNGIGFDPAIAEEDGHYGLRGIRERVEMIGGRVNIQSTLGRGSEIQILCPKFV